MGPTIAETTIVEIADRLFRISTRLPDMLPGGFTMNQFLIRDDQPLLFHTGPRMLFDAVRDAVARVLPPESVRYLAFSHTEADECGSINQWLALAPQAQAVCSTLAANVFLSDSADRRAVPMTDGERLGLGATTVRWLDAPHIPHGMDCGYMFDERNRALLCGDLFCHTGDVLPAVTEGDIFGPSEAMRAAFPYAPLRNAGATLDKLASTEPGLLALMHGSSYRGDGAALLRQLGAALDR